MDPATHQTDPRVPEVHVKVDAGGSADGYNLWGTEQGKESHPIDQLTSCKLDPLQDARIELFTTPPLGAHLGLGPAPFSAAGAQLQQPVGSSLFGPNAAPHTIAAALFQQQQQQQCMGAAFAGADGVGAQLPLLAHQQYAGIFDPPGLLYQQTAVPLDSMPSSAAGVSSLLPCYQQLLPTADLHALALASMTCSQHHMTPGPPATAQLLSMAAQSPPSPTMVQAASWASVVQRGNAPAPCPQHPSPAMPPAGATRVLFDKAGRGHLTPSPPCSPRRAARPGCPAAGHVLSTADGIRPGRDRTSSSGGSGTMTPPGTPGSLWQQQQAATPAMQALSAAAAPFNPGPAGQGLTAAQDAAAWDGMHACASAAGPQLAQPAGFPAGYGASLSEAAGVPASGHLTYHALTNYIVTTGVPSAGDPGLSPAQRHAPMMAPAGQGATGHAAPCSPVYDLAGGMATLLCSLPGSCAQHPAGACAGACCPADPPGLMSPCSSDTGFSLASSCSMLPPGLLSPGLSPVAAQPAPGSLSPAQGPDAPDTPTTTAASAAGRSPLPTQPSRLRKCSSASGAGSAASSRRGSAAGASRLSSSGRSPSGSTPGAAPSGHCAALPAGSCSNTCMMFMEMHDTDCSSYCLGGNLEPHKMWFGVGLHKAIRKLVSNNKRRHNLILAMHAATDGNSGYGDLGKVYHAVVDMHRGLTADAAGYASETAMKLWAGVEELMELIEEALRHGPGNAGYQAPAFLPQKGGSAKNGR